MSGIRNFTAENDINPFRIVKHSANGRTIQQAELSTDNAFGVTVEVGASAKERIDVKYSGLAVVETGGPVDADDLLTSDDQGRAIKAVITEGVFTHIIGQAFESATTSGCLLDFNIMISKVRG